MNRKGQLLMNLIAILIVAGIGFMMVPMIMEETQAVVNSTNFTNTEFLPGFDTEVVLDILPMFFLVMLVITVLTIASKLLLTSESMVDTSDYSDDEDEEEDEEEEDEEEDWKVENPLYEKEPPKKPKPIKIKEEKPFDTKELKDKFEGKNKFD